MKLNSTLLIALSMTAVVSGCKQRTIKMMPYPETRMDTAVVDNYFGTQVADPYRWLEDDNSEETAAWVKAENEVTQNYLSQIPYREKIKSRMTQLWNFAKYGIPQQVGEYTFFFENDGLQNQSILYRQKAGGEKEVFLNPNSMNDGGTVALGSIDFSTNDKYMAYTVAESGSDWTRIYVMDIETGKQLSDEIRWVKFSSPAWCGEGFFYAAYDQPKEGSELSGANQYQKVYYHKLGTPQSADELIYKDDQHPLRYYTPVVGKDERYLFLTSSEGTSGQELLYREVKSKGAFRTLYPGFSNDFGIVSCVDGKVLVYNNVEAANYKLTEIDLTQKSLPRRDLIPEGKSLLSEVSRAAGKLFVTYLQDASSHVYQYSLDGVQEREIALPGIGTTRGFQGKAEDTTIYYSFVSFNRPSTVYAYSVESGSSTVYKEPVLPYNPEDFEVKQIFYNSPDGTRIPMFLVYKKGIKLDGSHPTYLYAYGGFNISYTPGFKPMTILLMEQGGVYAVANLRGGGEYGEEWHRAGMLDKKQNVFDDYYAACEYLINEKYTTKEKLSVSGGSNGGLLIGAALTQRPDLFSVAFPQVGVLDMLRYHKFTCGWGWAVEYGSSDNQEQFQYIYKYSPLHNIKAGTCYPATMILTADHDDRVVPAHSFKFGATLQKAQGCENPILIRVESNAGHGAGKPVSKQIDENTDMLSFLFWNTHSSVKL